MPANVRQEFDCVIEACCSVGWTGDHGSAVLWCDGIGLDGSGYKFFRTKVQILRIEIIELCSFCSKIVNCAAVSLSMQYTRDPYSKSISFW